MVASTGRDAGPRRAAAAGRSAELRRWERLRAHGRSHFVWRHGVAGWGIPAAVVTMVYKVVEAQGLTWSPTLSPALRHALVLIAVAFPVLGYLFGGWLWTHGEERYRRLRGESERE